MYKKYVKRLLDIILSIILIIILMPLMIIIYIISIFDIKPPVIFKQEREGLYKKPFTIYKFKTLIDGTKTTKFTFLLRKTGLDELPQLFNILKGEMSFIGPRPFLIDETLPDDYIDPIRYTVKPGILGLAQSKGRRFVSHTKKLEYDVIYAKNVNFILDVKIFFKTIFVVIKQTIKK